MINTSDYHSIVKQCKW